MITQNYMQNKADNIVNLYSNLQNEIFNRIIFYLKDSNYKNVGKDNVLLWQAEQLSKMGMLTNDVIKMLSQVTGIAENRIYDLVVKSGTVVQDKLSSELAILTKKSNVKPDNHQMLNGLLQQTFMDMNNVVNQSLISRNVQENSALRTYQNIVNQTTVETITGLKTHEKAIFDNIDRWVKSGLKTNLVDKAGHNWSLEGYSRMVINSTAHNTFNQVRLSTMSEFDVTLAAMSSHSASRPACAPIQGKVVNLVPESDRRFNPKYDTIYNYGYGEPAGTQGINCHHSLYPFIEGVSTNPFEHPNTAQAIENGNVQQKQRALERNVRRDKKLLEYAKKGNDDVGVAHYKSMLSNHRSKIRDLVDEHDFLHRDYSREKIYNADPKSVNKYHDDLNIVKGKYERFRSVVGDRRPDVTLEEYRKALYNKGKDYEELSNDFRTHKTISESTNFGQREKNNAIETYYNFKKDGVYMSDHAVEQYQTRHLRRKSKGIHKRGEILFNYNSVLNSSRIKPNYENNGRDIRLYNKVALVSEKNGKVVSLYYVNKPRNKWTPVK